MVPRAGLEPARTKVRRILSPLRLPFRHHGTFIISIVSLNYTTTPELPMVRWRVEAAPGFEPGIRVLQTLALPLGYAAASLFLYFSLVTCILRASSCMLITDTPSSWSWTIGAIFFCKYDAVHGPFTGIPC